MSSTLYHMSSPPSEALVPWKSCQFWREVVTALCHWRRSCKSLLGEWSPLGGRSISPGCPCRTRTKGRVKRRQVQETWCFLSSEGIRYTCDAQTRMHTNTHAHNIKINLKKKRKGGDRLPPLHSLVTTLWGSAGGGGSAGRSPHTALAKPTWTGSTL